MQYSYLKHLGCLPKIQKIASNSLMAKPSFINLSIKALTQSAKGQKKKPTKLFDLFYNYQITMILLVLLITLIRQNFLANNFPFVLYDKQQIIKQNISINQMLDEENKQLSIDLEVESEANMEILESIARYKFGLLKEGERYYQISQSASNQDKP